MKTLTIALSLIWFSACTQAQLNQEENQISEPMTEVNKTEEEWQKELTPEQYYVLRQKGTERPFTGKFLNNKEKGVYVCAACGNELFSSTTKYDTHCGWPSFFDSLDSARIKTKRDTSHGMERIEIMCAKCGGHLGHVFDDGPQPTGQRYCVNSLSLDFKPEK